jgi:release factor glutamine methyltransferase
VSAVTRVGELLAEASRRLAEAGIPSPRLEARVLLAETLGASAAWVMAHPEGEVQPERRSLYFSRVSRRATHEPLAYIVGHREFYGLDLEVTPAVLIPRPETELLVEAALVAARRIRGTGQGWPLAVDLGTGSGAVAVAMAANLPGLRIIAVDISPEALAVARANAARHGVMDRIEFRVGDVLEVVPERPGLVVANLPYVPTTEFEALMPDVREHEPRQALDGGPEGTLAIARALAQGADRLERPGALLFEIGHGQGERLAAVARRLYPEATVQVRRDYAGLERILAVNLDVP